MSVSYHKKTNITPENLEILGHDNCAVSVIPLLCDVYHARHNNSKLEVVGIAKYHGVILIKIFKKPHKNYNEQSLPHNIFPAAQYMCFDPLIRMCTVAPGSLYSKQDQLTRGNSEQLNS